MTIASMFCATSRHSAALALAAALALGAGTAGADDASGAATPAAAPAKTEKCLLLNRIRHTRVVDQQTVLFYLSGNEIYKNALPHKCGALRPNEAFLYKSSINQICSVDTITPLMSTGGGYMASTSCGLGSFELIDKDAAEKLLADAKAARHSSN